MILNAKVFENKFEFSLKNDLIKRRKIDYF